MKRVIVIDDDPVQCRLTAEVVRKAGFEPLTAQSGEMGLAMLREDPGIAAVILDLVMPEMDGMSVMETMKRERMTQPIIVQTAKSSLETIVSAMRAGTTDFFVKPVAPERLMVSLRNALKLDALETAVRAGRLVREGRFGFEDIITRSEVMRRVIELGRKAAASTIPVLLEGESGVGKEMVARAIHGTGDRATRPFVAVNCGAIPGELVESTLFGHVKGAFSGAHENHSGKFAEAHGGTLFLDEIGELHADMQVKLLRALQDGEIEPVGAGKAQRVNVRVISATNRRLLNLAKSGDFREDLYYRLNVFPIYVPPLRERLADIPVLLDHFVARFAAEEGKRVDGYSPEVPELVKRYAWPGNIRQLENAVYRAVVLAEQQTLQPADFPQIMAHLDGHEDVRRETSARPVPAEPSHIDRVDTPSRPAPAIIRPPVDRFIQPDGSVAPLIDIERELIAFAIKTYNGRMAAVARALGIGRSTLYRKLRAYGLAEEKDDAA
ncbi:MAG: sigma-54 dependent transcriptional regulator [Cucumibacter sp.]